MITIKSKQYIIGIWTSNTYKHYILQTCSMSSWWVHALLIDSSKKMNEDIKICNIFAISFVDVMRYTSIRSYNFIHVSMWTSKLFAIISDIFLIYLTLIDI